MALTLSTRQASAAVVVAAVIWGLYWIPIRQMEAAGLSGAWATVLINLPAALPALVWVALRWQEERVHIARAIPVGLLTGSGLALFSLAIGETSVVRATLLFYLMPVWGTLLGILWLGEEARWSRWLAIGVGLTGLAVLVAAEPGAAINRGDVLSLIAGWCWAIAASLIKRGGAVPVAGMLASQFLAAPLVALVAGALLGRLAAPDGAALAAALPYAVALSIIAVLPATFLILWASQFLFPGRVGLLLMAEVAVAVISASILVPEEALAPVQWFAVAMIFGASLLELVPTRAAGPRSAGPVG